MRLNYQDLQETRGGYVSNSGMSMTLKKFLPLELDHRTRKRILCKTIIIYYAETLDWILKSNTSQEHHNHKKQ